MQDSPLARSPATAMRDLLRQLERQTIKPPARPTHAPLASMAPSGALTSTESASTASVVIGAWTLTEDAASGDLVATNEDGTTRIIATKGAL